MHLHWHRRDLRDRDNRALTRAADEREHVLPVFILDEAVLAHAGPPRTAFLLEALDALRARYRRLGCDLVIRRGSPSEELPRLTEAYGADSVGWNRDYSGLSRDRDTTVKARLDANDIEWETHDDVLLHEPGSILTTQDNPYAVYSYFWDKWKDREKDEPLAAPERTLATADDEESVPTLRELGFEDAEADVPPAGPGVARTLLEEFCAGPIYDYQATRDEPAAEATSRLSPHLKFGTIGVREVYAATETAKRDVTPEERESVETFQSQLAWREFYTHVLRFNPEVVTENYRSYERPIEWREDPDALRTWKDGRTGYPIVDAGMRQLRVDAWMHNRVRMIVASFLTKDLLIDWRKGYDWFRRKLVDHDSANDSGGWQWAAGTGTDAQPYFRIFNPMTQGERHDPDADYIKTYVPELRDVSPATIHDWHELDPDERERAAPEYPAPIVDHQDRREEALAMFEAARGEK